MTTPEPTAPKPEESPSVAGSKKKTVAEEVKSSSQKGRLFKLFLGILIVAVVGVLIVGIGTNWRFGAPPPNLPDLPADTVPLPGGMTYEELQEEVEASPPGSVLLNEAYASPSSAGWSVQASVINLSPTEETFTAVLLSTEGEELSSKEFVMLPSYIDTLQVYLPMGYDAAEVTLRVDGETGGEGLATLPVPLGTP